MKASAQVQAKNKKVEELKKVIKEIENAINNIETYNVEIYDEGDKYYLVIRDNNEPKIFEKELNEKEYDKVEDYLDSYTLYYDEIEQILKELEKDKIINQYSIDVGIYQKKEGWHTYYHTDYYIYLSLDEETLKEIEKDEELKDYLNEDNDLLITIDNVSCCEKSFSCYLDSFNEKHCFRFEIYYVTKEEAKNVIKAFSK